jgi:hypothetical protein
MKMISNRSIITALKGMLAGILLFSLSGCYMPIRFDAEIDIGRTGYYDLIFDGYLAKVELYQDIQEKKVTRDEELLQVQQIKEDFERDSAVSDFKYYEKATSTSITSGPAIC